MQVISKAAAQQIVETVRDVCDHNINFIDSDGIIFASTDASRIGDFHEIGRQVILQQKTIEVETDDSFLGTQKGVNIPFLYHGEVAAVIGISGVPKEVRKYAYLAQKITQLILREHELNLQNRTKEAERDYVVLSLIRGESIGPSYLSGQLEQYHLDISTPCRTVILRINPRYNPSNLYMIEGQIHQVFARAKSSLYTFHFPDEYILLLETEKWNQHAHSFEALAKKYQKLLSIGVGNIRPLIRQNQSYDAAALALHSLIGTNNFAVFDNLDLEVLLGSIPENARAHYLQKTIEKLNEKERSMLITYFACGMSLKTACEQLYIHKNTLQYQLDKVWHTCGYNPRFFHDAVVLYLALRLEPTAGTSSANSHKLPNILQE